MLAWRVIRTFHDWSPPQTDIYPDIYLILQSASLRMSKTHMERLLTHPHLSAVSEHLGTPTHVTLGAGACSVVLLLALIIALFRSTFSSRSSRPVKRTTLPAFAFDVEGGSHGASNGTGKALHPSIAQAAANADVATLRNWICEWQHKHHTNTSSQTPNQTYLSGMQAIAPCMRGAMPSLQVPHPWPLIS